MYIHVHTHMRARAYMYASKQAKLKEAVSSDFRGLTLLTVRSTGVNGKNMKL